jgi:UDP-N-acetyl-D-mannosaminuronic acid dehydrogenase
MDKLFDRKILVIGLGEIGYTCSEYLRDMGLKVDGFDISQDAIKRALDAGIISGVAKDFSGYDYYFVCISTHLPSNQFEPYLDSFFELIQTIHQEGKPNSLISIESTIPYGTTKKILEIINHKMHVVHVPHRYWRNEKKEHGVNQLRVLGASHDCCTKLAEDFYGKILGIPIHPVDSAEIAELSKVVENTYIFLQIAFAEELKMVCDSRNISFEDLRNACNTKWNIDIFEAHKGIGGHCLPKDTKMFLSFGDQVLPKSLLETAMAVDLKYRAHVMKLPLLNRN